MDKIQICETLAQDYADRAAKGGANYDDAYEHYLARCLNRDEEDLKSQYKTQGLGKNIDGFIISSELM